MNTTHDFITNRNYMTWKTMPKPAKALATAVILVLGVAMAGALAQIIVHDIIPTFFSDSQEDLHATGHSGDKKAHAQSQAVDEERGDIFAETTVKERTSGHPPFYNSEQFVWTLKWTHIHLFGMNMIFIFMGMITLFLDMSTKARTWLIVLPFCGVLVDIAAVWLKGYISPAFFWLHLPGGFLFGATFVFVSLKALGEMWFFKRP